MVKPCFVLLLSSGLACAAAMPAQAFWERSQWARCSEAQTAEAWLRFRCFELEPGRNWKVLPGAQGGIGGGSFGPEPDPGVRRGVTRRLG